jgi:hypothetical protein
MWKFQSGINDSDNQQEKKWKVKFHLVLIEMKLNWGGK